MLIAGPLAFLVVMFLHPTGHALMSEQGGRLARMNSFVHGLAIAATPVVFLGLLGLARRLGSSHLTKAALVACGFGSVAVMSAAVGGGFVATGVIEEIVAADGSPIPHALLEYTHLWNQAFATIFAVAYSAGILLFSAAILKSARMGRAGAVYGFVVGLAVMLALLSGHIAMDIHGFGAITLAQSSWLIWMGVGLCRTPTRS